MKNGIVRFAKLMKFDETTTNETFGVQTCGKTILRIIVLI